MPITQLFRPISIAAYSVLCSASTGAAVASLAFAVRRAALSLSFALAKQAAGSAERSAIQAQVMALANATGEKILPGELARGLRILADGGEIDYDGATGVELAEPGEVPGTCQEMEVEGGAFVTKALH